MKKARASLLSVLLLLAWGIAACDLNNFNSSNGTIPGGPPPGVTPIGPGPAPGPILQTLPPNEPRPQPVVQTFQDCPPQGDGGDPELNRLKNRIDAGRWLPASVASVLALTWPQAIEQHNRSLWSGADRANIAEYEGLPLQLEGYMLLARAQGPESTNCHSVDDVDYHIWMADAPDKDRTQSVVIEVTPRVRALHPGWTIDRIRNLSDRHDHVRISGWLLLDQDHPDQVGKTRGSIWEIHPIIQIAVEQNGAWVPLDNGDSAISPPVAVPTQADEPPPLVETPEPGVIAPTARPAGHGASTSPVQITVINAKGSGSNQADEYVEIVNQGNDPVIMDGWTLSDAAGHTFTWDSFTIQPNQTIRVYTNQVHNDSGGFSYHSSGAIWNNDGDQAYLKDANGTIVATFHYGNKQ